MSATAPRPARARRHVRVRGTVQGVGFRPFVYRLAHEQDLGGWVLNDGEGVLLEIEGASRAVEAFLRRLTAEAPPLAVIDGVECDRCDPRGERAFEIRASPRAEGSSAPVTPDCATCAACLAELADPGDRRHRYPFINCTDCGPRFTIVTATPYDRPQTTMAPFQMCPDCRREYENPLDRRFHAQPNACPRCGPALRIAVADGTPIDALGAGIDAVDWVAGRLAAGAVVAVKGLGGFHLVCDATNEPAVLALRARKHREDKPFALMVASVAAARRLVRLDPADATLLTGAERPIVLAPRRGAVAASVAPGMGELGVMLPYTPLHHLLVGDFGRACGDPYRPLVMTSGNVSDEPIAFTDQDALTRLAPIADLFLLHDRAIRTRTDDSVVRTVALPTGRRPLMVRRSRGYVPAALSLPVPARRPLLACGAEQKNTFCVAAGAHAWVGHHIGDLEHYATLRAYADGVTHFERLFSIAPELVAHDLHPDYLSTRYALQRETQDAIACVAVQHHHAHLAACLAEYGVTGPAVGAIYDGTGLGPDQTIWGGELLCGNLIGCERAGSLWPVRMPGGAAAIRQPWRMAAAWLAEAFGQPRPVPRHLRAEVPSPRWATITGMASSAELSPTTSSVGRLLDAVGAVCGLGAAITYEGQAAIALEAAAWESDGGGATYACELTGDPTEDPAGGARLVIDPRAMLRAVADDLETGAEIPAVAAGVHAALAEVTVTAIERIAARRCLDTAVLSGGVFQNRWLLGAVARDLHRDGLRVLVPERLPPNDGAIAFGQAAVAAARDALR